jgi:hypothetical protein
MLLAIALLSSPTVALAQGYDCSCGKEPTCGCASHAKTCCKHHGCWLFGHHHKHCCCEQDKSLPKETRLEQRVKEIPYGPVVDSMAVMRMSPAIMTMQVPVMVGGVQKVAFEQPTVRETSCETSQKNLLELEARIDALDKRTQVILTAIEFQTKFLEDLKSGAVKLPRE